MKTKLVPQKIWLEEIGEWGYFYSPSTLFEMRMDAELSRVKIYEPKETKSIEPIELKQHDEERMKKYCGTSSITSKTSPT